jgi:hypothetical protein
VELVPNAARSARRWLFRLGRLGPIRFGLLDKPPSFSSIGSVLSAKDRIAVE